MSRELHHMILFPRASGRTTAICEAAKKIGATVICHTSNYAKDVSRRFGVNTIALHELERARGTGCPYLMDHNAIAHVLSGLSGAASDLWETLEKRNKTIEMLERKQTVSGLNYGIEVKPAVEVEN